MAVRDMVRDLAHGPAIRTVGRVELLVRKPFHGCVQASRRLLDVLEQFLTLFRRGRAVVSELADGIARIRHGFLRVRSVASQMIGNTWKVQESDRRLKSDGSHPNALLRR